MDENVSPLDDDHLDWADIVLTMGVLPQQTEILKIIERAHNNGKTVVIGAVNPTTQTQIQEQAAG